MFAISSLCDQLLRRVYKMILLTGANGFVGRHYLNTLHPFAEPVYAVDLDTPHVAEAQNKIVTARRCDLTNKADAMALIDSVKPMAIIHLAAISKVGDDSAVKVNVGMAHNIFDGIFETYKDMTPPKVVIAGSASEYGDIKSDEVPPDEYAKLLGSEPYALSKIYVSRVAHAYRTNFNIPITILRFANIYGPRQPLGKLVPNLVESACNGKTITLNGNGTPTRQWLYVDDAIRAIDTSLNHMNTGLGSAYNIGDPNEISLHGLAIKIVETVSRIKSRRGELQLISKIALKSGSGGAQRVAMDMTRAKRVLAWEPRVPLSTGLERTILAYLADQDAIYENEDSGRSSAYPSDLLGSPGAIP